MRQYTIKRIGLFIPTVLLVTVSVFVVMRLIPGDPALAILSADDAAYTEQELQELRVQLGTDRPIVVQYFDWMSGLLRGDFGTSYFYEGEQVFDDIKQRLPVTIELGLLSLFLASVVAIPLGVLSAVKQDTLGDYATRVITIMGIALPNFWVGIMTIFFLVLFFNWAPPLDYAAPWEDPWINIQQLIFPAIALGTSNMAFIARITRSAMLEVLHEDYIRTARAKGLRENVVVFRHALRNALLPVVTVTGFEFGRLISGSVIIEVIFLVPGMGRLLITSITHRDFPMIQAIIVLIAVVVLVLNLILDLTYAWLNPRIRYS
jgi:peptide/nickel transport system permease protein